MFSDSQPQNWITFAVTSTWGIGDIHYCDLCAHEFAPGLFLKPIVEKVE